MKVLATIVIGLISFIGTGQSYTSYFTGDAVNAVISPTPPGGICMMGGASENDEAMKWFLTRAFGGDVLVIRASGSDGYNNYMYSDLGVNVNSVETIVFNNPSAAYDSYVLDRISKAEAVWIAGGDQWDYVSYWRNTPVDSLINDGIANRGMTIGGTSAGMAIQGRYYFSAENGTITSSAALQNPTSSSVTADTTCFIKNDYLQDVITDSHYDSPDRKGRHVVFLADLSENYGVNAKGIACNEYTAVCIDENGIARVYGEYPQYDEFAYFISKNCELNGSATNPEVFSAGTPLTWSYSEEILKAYKVPGTMTGANTFDLNDWKTGSGGSWFNWWVDNGTFMELAAAAPDCTNSINDLSEEKMSIYPNPTQSIIHIEYESKEDRLIEVLDFQGRITKTIRTSLPYVNMDLSEYSSGVYHIKTTSKNETINQRIIKD